MRTASAGLRRWVFELFAPCRANMHHSGQLKKLPWRLTGSHIEGLFWTAEKLSSGNIGSKDGLAALENIAGCVQHEVNCTCLLLCLLQFALQREKTDSAALFGLQRDSFVEQLKKNKGTTGACAQCWVN
jgi:hypothetical protein